MLSCYHLVFMVRYDDYNLPVRHENVPHVLSSVGVPDS